MNKFTFYKTMMMVALLFATTVLSHAAVGDKWKEGKLYYKVTAEGTPNTVEVVPQNDGSPYWDDAEKPTGDLTIPATVTHVGITYDVTSIGEEAFFNCYGLTSVTIPNSVTSIGESAFFSCSGLTSVTIPNSVTSIGESAFHFCSYLTSVTIPNSVTSIGAKAFSYCNSLTSVIIPNSVTSIGESAFFSCRGLTSVSIPNSVTSIGESTFSNCSSLTAIEVNNANTAYISQDGVLFNKDKTTLIQYPAGKTEASYAIPNSVTSIKEAAFSYCNGLTSVTIPNSVTSIGARAFSGCSGLTAIEVNNANTSYLSQDGVVFNKDKTTLIQYPAGKTETSYTIPNSVTSIGEWAFSICTGLTSITIPNSVTSIGESAFGICTGLTSITIPNSVTSIGAEAFSNCNGLTAIFCLIDKPANITTMGGHVFRYVSKKIPLFVPAGIVGVYQVADQWREFNSIQEIASAATGVKLNENTKMLSLGRDFILKATMVPNNAIPNVIWSSNNTAVATVDNGGKVSAKGEGDATITVTTKDGGHTATCVVTVTIVGYKFKHTDGLYYKVTGTGTPSTVEVVPQNDDRPYWDDAEKPTGDLTIPATVMHRGITYDVTSIEKLAFSICTGLTSISIPNSVTSIKEAAFSRCSGLTSVSIPNSVTSIEKLAFSNCSGLTSVSIPNSVTSIGEWAFYNCSGLTAIEVNNANTAYSSHDGVLFNKDKTTLIQYPAGKTETSYAIPNSVTSIKEAAFSRCSGLTSVSIPNSVTSIEKWAFSNCSGLAAIEVDNANTAYSSQDGVWFNKDKTTLIQYPVGKTETSYTIPNSVTSIGARAFYNCKDLSSVTIPNSVTSIGKLAFSRCSGLTSVTCLVGNPANITLGGYGVFYYVPFGTVTLYVPAGSVGNYQAADQWKKFTNIQEITSATGVILSVKAKILKVGDEFTLKATVQPDHATNKAVTWASSDAAVATVDVNGKVKALKAGETTITATTVDGGKTATCKLTVTVPVESIALNKTSKTLKIGEEVALVATITPDHATNKAVTWTSRDKTVATVDNGKVKAVKEGETTITVKTVDGGKTATCTITVDKNTGIGDIENTSEFVLYPTLVQTGFTIKFANETPKPVMLNIYTLSGAKISSEIINSQKQYVNISNLQKGIYIVKIKSHSVKIVKE